MASDTSVSHRRESVSTWSYSDRLITESIYTTKQNCVLLACLHLVLDRLEAFPRSINLRLLDRPARRGILHEKEQEMLVPITATIDRSLQFLGDATYWKPLNRDSASHSVDGIKPGCCSRTTSSLKFAVILQVLLPLASPQWPDHRRCSTAYASCDCITSKRLRPVRPRSKSLSSAPPFRSASSIHEGSA